MKNIKFLNIIWILFYIFIFLFLIKNSYEYLDPDLGWHLKVGEEIYKEKQVPSLNYYNYTLEGKKWVDHEWLSNLGLFIIYEKYGYFFTTIFFALIILASLIILNIFTKKYFLKNKNDSFFIIIFQLLGIFAMFPHLGIRIQEITILMLLLLIIIINQYEKNKKNKILFFIPFLFFLWACLHAGFLIGLFVLFSFISIKSIELLFLKIKKISVFIDDKKILPLKKIIIFSLFSFLGLLATFLTPYGLKLYSFLFDYKNSYYLKHITEWLGQNNFPFNYYQILYLILFSTSIFIYFYLFKNKKINFWQILLSIFFLFLAFKSRRHFPLFFIISFPFIVSFFSSFFNIPDIFIKKNKKPFINFFIKFYLITCFLVALISTTISIKSNKNPFINYCKEYPCEAVKFLKENEKKYENFNFLALYGWGGYLIHEMPEKKLFIDGRLPQYKFAGHTILEEYCEFFKENNQEKKINEYNIKLILLEKKEKKYRVNWFEKYFIGINEEKINNKKNYLKNYLDTSTSWVKEFENKTSVIYVKKI